MLVLLDLDDFKAANDRAGHLAGDEILRAFAKGVSAIMRREDLIGRIGGDEFALLVRVPSIAEGQCIARDIHARLSAVLAQSRYPVTRSAALCVGKAGVSTCQSRWSSFPLKKK